MATKSVADLILEIRNRTDTLNSAYISDDPELIAYVNSSLGQLYDQIIGSNEDYLWDHLDVTLNSADALNDTNFISTPTNMAYLRGVDKIIGGAWATLYEFGNMERNRFAFPFISVPAAFYDAYYRLAGERIYLIPAITAPGQYRIWFTAEFTPLTTSDDLPSYMTHSSWYEYAVVDVCAKILQKQDLDPSTFLAQKAEQQARVMNACSPRDTGGVRVAVDTRNLKRNRGWGWGGGFGNNGDWS